MITAVVILVGAAAAGLIGATAGWIPRPAWMRRRHAVTVLVLVTAAIGLLTVLQDVHDRSAPKAPDTRVPQPAELADLRVLTLDDSAGRPILFSSKGDGSGRQPIIDPVGLPLAPTADGQALIGVEHEVDSSHVVVFDLQGDLIRRLTSATAWVKDTSPTVATGQVYFIREFWRDQGEGVSAMTGTAVMSVPLKGGTARKVPTSGREFRSISASTAGRTLAGVCVAGHGPLQACLLNPRTGTAQHLGISTNATVSDIAMSPDGTRFAYSSPSTNPYGAEQIHVYDVSSKDDLRLTAESGKNSAPSWIPNTTCVSYAHYERPTGSSIHYSCLASPGVSHTLLPVGSSPLWLPPPHG